MMKRCLIIGNGPSLRGIPNELLDKYITFGCNRIYLKHVPNVYVYVDPLAHRQGWTEDIEDLICAKFLAADTAQYNKDAVPLNCIHEAGFSLEPMRGVYAYFSATTVMLQLAVWMGFRDIGLIGFDHKYQLENGERHIYTADGNDINHFTPDYYPEGAKYNAPRLDLLTRWHYLAKQTMDAEGVRVTNLTGGSDLHVYPMEYWYSWLK
jgi:hypothetical protein